jgi:cell division protein FtsB
MRLLTTTAEAKNIVRKCKIGILIAVAVYIQYTHWQIYMAQLWAVCIQLYQQNVQRTAGCQYY